MITWIIAVASAGDILNNHNLPSFHLGVPVSNSDKICEQTEDMKS